MSPLDYQYTAQVSRKNSLRFTNCCIHKKLHKMLKFQGQFDLEDQGEGDQLLNTSEIFR